MKTLPLRRPSFFYGRKCFQKTMSHALGSKVIAELKMFPSLNVNPCNNVHYYMSLSQKDWELPNSRI